MCTIHPVGFQRAFKSNGFRLKNFVSYKKNQPMNTVEIQYGGGASSVYPSTYACSVFIVFTVLLGIYCNCYSTYVMTLLNLHAHVTRTCKPEVESY